MADRGLLRQGLSYGFVGLLQLVCDWLCFVGLTIFGVSAVPANITGRVSGALLGYWLNGVLTFRGTQGDNSDADRVMRFVISWSAMSILSTIGVHLTESEFGLQMAWLLKPGIDAGLAVVGFIVSKRWIYK